MSAVTLEYRVPAADLQPYVTLFYHFRADVPLFDDIERADHAQLRFRLRGGGDARYCFADGTEQIAAKSHVIGPTSGAIRTIVEGPVEVIGMGLQPAGWLALFGIDASGMLNRSADAGHLLGAATVATACAAMDAAPDTDGKVAVAEQLVRCSIARRDEDSLVFAAAIDAWLAHERSPAVDDLVAVCGLSRRQVERRTKALYGVPPKVLARKYRALRTAVALAGGAATDLALADGGFYDQSHLIRELKQFTGLTPRQMHDAPGLLAQLTIQNRRALEGKVHLIISDT